MEEMSGASARRLEHHQPARRPRRWEADTVAGREAPVEDALGWLLEHLDRRPARAFVQSKLAALAAYDREHGTDLQHVLELALDHPNRGEAADAAYMHRNTFRRQLRKAVSVLDADLAHPEERLAVHLALKLRAVRPPMA